MLEAVGVGSSRIETYRGVAPDHRGVDECAAAVVELAADRQRARALGEAGRERVRERFLTPRLALDHLQLMRALSTRKPLVREPGWLREHDPVCGMTLGGRPDSMATHQGATYGFCSDRCRREFLRHPDLYASTA